MKITKEAFNQLIQRERNAQDAKWGEQRHSDERWLAIALEELGEAAKAVLEENDEALLVEVVQVAAVLENWVTSRDFSFEELGASEEFDEKIRQHFVVIDEMFEVLLKGYINEQRNVILTFRHNAPDEGTVSEKYSSFDVILNMIPVGTLPTIQFGDKDTIERFAAHQE